MIRFRRIFTSAIATLLVAIPSMASAACEDILKYVNYDVQRNYSSLDQQQVNLATFCSAEYSSASSSKQAAIAASYKVFSGSASGSATNYRVEQERLCKNNYGRDFLATLNIESTEIVSAPALAAVEACNRQNSFEVVSLTPSETAFTAALKWNGSADTNVSAFNISKYRGKPVADCVATMPTGETVKLSAALPRGQTMTLSCDRTLIDEPSADPREAHELYPAGLVTIGTAAGAISIPLVEVRKPVVGTATLTGLEAQNAALRTQLAALMTQAGAYEQRIGVLEGRKPTIKVSDPGTFYGWTGPNNRRNCPADEVMVSFQSGDNRDFRYACAKITVE